MVSDDHLSEFTTVGYIRLPNAVSAAAVTAMRAATWAALAVHDIVENDPSTWTHADDQTWIAVKPQERSIDTVGPEDSPTVRAMLDALFGANRSPTHDWGKTLVALPERTSAWTIPQRAWHFDHLYPSPGHITAVNLFLLIDDVAVRGGGTAVVRNSPQLLDQLLDSGANYSKVSKQNQVFIGATDWTRGLTESQRVSTDERNSRYETDTVVEGVTLRVDELSGSAGDVFVCHPALLHTISMNTSSRPRLMRVQRIRSTAL